MDPNANSPLAVTPTACPRTNGERKWDMRLVWMLDLRSKVRGLTWCGRRASAGFKMLTSSSAVGCTSFRRAARGYCS